MSRYETNGTASELRRYDAGMQARFGGDIQRLDVADRRRSELRREA
jgi:hypothetical protein